MILVNSKTIATMKNIFKSLMLVAVAAMGFACQEAKEENYTPTNPREVVMTIIADMDEETRTYISDEANGKIAWSEGDQLKVIENSAVYSITEAATIGTDGKAQFAVSFPKNSGAVAYNAVFPASAVVEDDEDKIDAAKVKVIVKDQQKPTATSFDPQADILVSKQLEFDAQPIELNMQFKRLVAMGKMTLKNLPADAKISQVVFTAGAKDVLAGRNYVNAATGKVSEYGYFGDTNIVTLNYDDAISTRDIYFTCNPFDMATGDTFKVKVVCEDYTYTREVIIPEDSSLEFTEGDMTTFTVNMKDATIESSFVFADGVYAVIAKSSDKYYAMKGVKGSGDYMTHVEVSYDGEASTFATNDETLGWIIAAVEGGYTFQNNEGKYLYWSSGNYSNLGDASKAQVMTITPIDGTSQYKVAVKDTPERILSYNASSPRFAFYGNTEQKYELYLVPVVADTTPRFTVSPNAMQTINADGGTIEFKVDEYNGAEVSAQSSDNSWLTIDNSTFIATVQPNQTATERSAKITFSAEGAESVEVTVTQAEKLAEDAVLVDAILSFASTNQRTEYSTSKQVWEQNGVKLTNDKGSSTSNIGDYAAPARFYKSSKITIEALGPISKLVFNCSNNEYATNLGNSIGAAATVNNATVTVNLTTTVESYVISLTGGQVRLNSLTVTYLSNSGESGGDEPEAPADPVKLTMSDLTISETSNSITVSWAAVSGAESYAVSLNDGATTTTTTVTSPTTYTFEGLTASTSYTVSVVAKGDGVNYTDSDAKETTVQTLEETPEQPTVTAKFVKVTSAPSDWSGTYLIVYEAGKLAFDGSRSTLDAVSNTKSVTISNGEIEATDAMKAITFTIAKNGSNYTIKSASGKYIGNNSNSNALTANTSFLYNTIAFVSADDITIKGNGGSYLRYNATSGQTRFRYFKSSTYTSQKAIQLYKLSN